MNHNNWDSWKSRRVSNLTSENGWLTLCGLVWLDEEKEYPFGSNSKHPIVLPKGPQDAGTITRHGDHLKLIPIEGVNLTINGNKVNSVSDIFHDDDGNSTSSNIQLDSITILPIKRGPKIGLRIKDKQNPARINFKGFEYFDYDPKWCLEATFEKFDTPKTIPIKNVFGWDAPEKSSGALVFHVEGQEYKLDVIDESGSDEFFIIFKDQTNGKETYGMRFLYVPFPDKDNKTTIDFNRAYNPPCAFSDYATCPVPHPQNRLPFRIEAGEKKYEH
eukprot:TRINITY_DN525_c0_g1_i1.p1 TRINITY_DN525_c0_g1~~TRINITY_DN525_c0_g1_i1.p1  ORF type:complete len:274 (-),score=78.45 TRINITY_DN525_c0_g1_i1:9-830(-)